VCVQHLEALFAELCAQLQEANGLEQKAGKRSKSKTDAGAGAVVVAAAAPAAAPAPPAAAAKAQVVLSLLALLVQKCQYGHLYMKAQVLLDAAPAHESPQQMRALI
jgi:hypothetical protein